MKTFLLTVLAVCLWVGAGAAQVVVPPVVISAGFPDAMYPPGSYESPMVVVPLGSNTFGLSIDRTNFLDHGTTINFELDQFVNGSWQLLGAAGTSGGVLAVSASAFAVSAQANLPAPTVVKATMEVIGNPVQTNSAIRMWEIR